MTGSNIREIRKRIDPGLSNFRNIYGCYVNGACEIICEMDIPVEDMDTEERGMYAAILKGTVSGPPGRHFLKAEFSPAQVEDSDEHRLLMGLREKHLSDSGLRTALYEKIIETFDNDGKSYVILLAADTYDLKARYEDENWSDDESEEQFEYFICSICRVRSPKAALRYHAEPKVFRGSSTGSILAGPVVGFMFPAFIDRQADIYTAAWYTKDVDNIHDELIEGLFNIRNVPSCAATKKETFGRVLYETLGTDCTLDVMTGLQVKLGETLQADDEEGASSEIGFDSIADILKEEGIPEEKAEAFTKRAEEAFGGSKNISIHAIAGKNTYRITSSEAEISADALQAARFKTTKIDGITYILVPAGADVRVNGYDVSI